MCCGCACIFDTATDTFEFVGNTQMLKTFIGAYSPVILGSPGLVIGSTGSFPGGLDRK